MVAATKKACYEKKKKQYNARTNANYNLNKNHVLEQQRGYKEQHKDKLRIQMNEYIRNRYANDSDFAMHRRCSARLKAFLKSKGAGKQAETMQLVGCSSSSLVQHLRKQLNDDSDLKDHDIDHIFPCIGFEVGQEGKMMHFSNLQPLTAAENNWKRNKLPTKAMAAKVDPACWPDGVTMDMLPDIYPGWATPLRMHVGNSGGASSSTDAQ